jgi:hypothetical protein
VEATVHVKDNGLFTLNIATVNRLGLINGCGVSFCAEKSLRNCFAIMRDAFGYPLRGGVSGQMFFNCVELARHIIDSTLMRGGIPAGAVKPRSMVFIVAHLPVDDKSPDVYALIQKK